MRKIILALMLTVLLAGCYELSDGERAGVIVKFSKRGYFCKTWEGQMNLGGMRKEAHSQYSGNDANNNPQYRTVQSIVPNTWDFTVEDPSLVPVIQKAFEEGRAIRLHYREEMVSFCRSDGNSYFITKVATN